MSENPHPNSLDLPAEDNPKSNKVGVRTSMASMMWSAPLPPPNALAKYNDAFPGCAERIVNAADVQAQHRQHLETITIEGKVKSEHRAQWMAFVIALTMLLGGFVLIYLNKNILGTFFVGGDITAIVGIFLYGKYDQKKQLDRKRATVEPPLREQEDDQR